MKKVLLTLMVMAVAMPAMAADVDFTITNNDDGSFTISYVATTAPRGIALTVDAGTATVGDAALGENGDVLSTDPAFNCFMDFASDDPGNYVLGAGNPLADPAAAGEPTYPASQFSICMGVLDETGNQAAGPLTSADLVTIQLSNVGGCQTVTIDADTFRGGPAVGDAALTTNLPQSVDVCEGGCDLSDAAFAAQWAAVGQPEGWCAENNPRQCHGDADGAAETKQSYWAYTKDLTCLLAGWGLNAANVAGVTDTFGVPAINADFDHLSETKQQLRVYTADLTILLDNWGTAGGPAADCANVTGVQ